MGEIAGKVECHVENEVTHVLNCDQRGNHQKWATSTSTVDGALEEILRASAPHLWEKQLLEIIDQFDDKEDRERIDAYKRTIARLQYRLQTKEDPYAIRWVIATILKS